MSEPVFGVVLLNWNGCDDTIAALDSLRIATPRPDHVIVVDNASRDDSVARLRDWVSDRGSNDWVTLLELPVNRGFPGGNNAGLERLAAIRSVSHFLLLNNDTTVQEDCFAQLKKGVVERPDGALFTTTIYEADGRTVWYAGGTEHKTRALVLHDRVVPSDQTPRTTEFISGCAMLIPRPTYVVLGGLAEVYFPLYWEDAEYSRRARTGIGPLIYLPGAVVYHKVGSSVGMPSVTPRVAFIQNHHRAMFVRRNYRGVQRLASLSYLLVTKPARFAKEVLKGNARVGWSILTGALTGMLVTDPERGRPAPDKG